MEVPDLGFTPTVPTLLRRAVDRFGDDDYVVTAWDRCTFAEADEASWWMARRLVAAGAGKGTRIGLLLPSGVAFAVAWLAVARIGALSMLFSTTSRPAELLRLLRTADAQFLVVPRSLVGRDMAAELEEAVPGLVAQRADRIAVPAAPYLRSIWMIGETDRPWATPVDPADRDPGHPEGGRRAAAGEGEAGGWRGLAAPDVGEELLASMASEVSPADPLTVIYTSGSTADPKGVIHTHGTAVRKVAPEVGLGLSASQGGRTFCAMPFFWVGGPQMLLGALHTGATIACQERFDVEDAVALIRRERCTTLAGWATLQQQIRDVDHRSSGGAPSSLLPAEIPPGTVSSGGHPRNVGMSETFGPHADPRYFDYKVVDPGTGERVPDGEEGEFCVRGFGLMAGMVKREREDLLDADGYYRTGDRGYLEAGHIYFTGRFSEMIKTGGANVAPLEVEAVLRDLPDVAEAYVVGVADPDRGEAVVALVVPDAGAQIEPADLQARLRAELSAYKVPRRIAVVDHDDVPLLGTGKPDKRAMRVMMEANGG